MSIAVDNDAATLVAPPSGPVCWEDADRAHLVCRGVLEITHDVKTFMFEAEDGSLFHFEPGQFITLELEIQGQPVSRCYTVSSPPTRPHLLAITVKRVVGGPVSNWLHDTLQIGSRLPVAAPLGQFTLERAARAKFLFLSAGSGITPLMSMTRTLVDLASDADVVFVHSARTPVDIIFRRELDAIAAVMPNIEVVHICEDDHPAERWDGLRGRLTAEVLQTVAPDLAERVVYTCGPAPYMAAVRGLLRGSGYDMAGYHEESYSFDQLPVGDQIAADALLREDDMVEPSAADAGADDGSADAGAAVTFSVEFLRSKRTVVCAADQFVLDAATAAGMRLPSSCSQGMCGTCKTTMVTGTVDMQHNGGIRPKEIALGKVLICCSKPLSDLQIDS